MSFLPLCLHKRISCFVFSFKFPDFHYDADEEERVKEMHCHSKTAEKCVTSSFFSCPFLLLVLHYCCPPAPPLSSPYFSSMSQSPLFYLCAV